jgi:hypothetical protein
MVSGAKARMENGRWKMADCSGERDRRGCTSRRLAGVSFFCFVTREGFRRDAVFGFTGLRNGAPVPTAPQAGTAVTNGNEILYTPNTVSTECFASDTRAHLLCRL